MKILLTSATLLEIKPLIEKFELNENTFVKCHQHEVQIFITGVGIPCSLFHFCKRLQTIDFDLLVHVGIAGAYHRDLQIGEVVQVTQDCFADLGIETENGIETLNERGLDEKLSFEKNNYMINRNVNVKICGNLKKVKGATVNKANCNENSIHVIRKKYKSDIETMESAISFYVCGKQGVSFVAIRSISNYVTIRKNAEWNISKAVENLVNYCISIV